MGGVAVIGAGYWGRNLVRNFHDLQSLGAVCDASQEVMDGLRSQYPDCRYVFSYRDILQDASIRAVAVATPAETHAALVREALLAGKDVFVEKPLCLSVTEGRDLVALAAERQRVLMVGHLLWYHPAVLKLKELVTNGDLGRLQYIYSNRLNLGKIRREENILWSFAPHDISVILGLLDQMPDEISCHGGNYLHQQVADATVSLLSFPSGVKAHVFVSWLHPFKEQKLVVVGDRKMAVFDDVEKKDKLLLYPHSINWRNHMPVASRAEAQPVPFEAAEPLRSECEHFLDCVRSRCKPRTDGEEGLRVLTILHVCQQQLEKRPATKPLSRPHASRGYSAHESVCIDEDVQIGDRTSIWHVSHVMKGSRIGRNCRIGQNVVIGPNAVIGDGVKIQNNVSVYEGVVLEDDVFCGPSMVFTNVINPRSAIPRMAELRTTFVRRGATLGANATILCGITIGEYAFVGAGAVVTKDVPPYALVVGNPARQTGWMCACGVRLRLDEEVASCGGCRRRYAKKGARLESIVEQAVHV
jgi:UDP-2-acetamido-3-amino-2,3-dideoxy-glucuronate N-acetyltransferase